MLCWLGNISKMKRIFTSLLFILTINTCLYAQDATSDSITREQYIHSQTVKSDTLNQMALQLATPGASTADLNKAINLIMSGLHTYARFRDTIGLRETFDHLAFVYHLQKKYVQAKWFYIQSNTFSRQLKDTANIINSLIALSKVKLDIKDKDLAESDLQEALALAKTQPGIQQQVRLDSVLSEFYTKIGNNTKARLFIKRIAFINDSITKATIAKNQVQIRQSVATNTERKTATVQQTSNHSTLITAIIIAIFLLLFIAFYLKSKRRKR